MKQIWNLALSQWPRMLLASFWAFATVASSVGLMMCSGYVLSAAALHPSIAVLATAIVGVRFFGIARGAFRWLERMVAHETALHLLERFRLWFYARLEPLVPIGIRHLRHGDLLQALARDVDSLEFLYVRVVAPPLVALWTLFLMMILQGRHQMSFVLCFASSQLLAILVSLGTLPFLAKWSKRARQQASQLQSLLLDLRQGFREIQAAGTYPAWHQALFALEGNYNQTLRRMNTLTSSAESLVPAIGLLGVGSIILLGTQEVRLGTLDPITWITLVMGAWAAFESVLAFPALAQGLQASTVAGTNLLAIANLPNPSAPSSCAPPSPGAPLLSIQNLDFTWPDGAPLFRNFSLALKAGERVAMLGDSGIGKSTLVHLICGYLAPTQGSISLDRSHLAILEQQPQFFTGTLADNLRIAKADASNEEMQQVLEECGLWEWALQANPESPSDAWIGEQGSQISGGQRQRLACAQVLLREAKLIILDEPAAHLDPESEEIVLEIFLRRTPPNGASALLVITHRPQFLARFDRSVQIHGVTG